jgi:hypothetical protein
MESMKKLLNFKELWEPVWGASESVGRPSGGKVWLHPPGFHEIPLLSGLLHTEVSSLTGTLQAIFAHNRDSFWAAEHLPPGCELPTVFGLHAVLPGGALA